MAFQLNPAFNYIADSFQGRGYIVNKRGGCSVVNEHAMSLLRNYRHELEENPKYKVFFSQAKLLQWLIPNTNQHVIVRNVPSAYHLKRVQYEILLKCNLMCAHCYCSSSPAAPMGMNTASVKDLIDQMSQMGVLYLDFTGGEPLVRSDIFELIQYAQEQGIIVSLFTNATIITDEMAGRLSNLGIASIQTSLDAYTPELHDQFRGRKGAFQKAVNGIKTLRKYQVPVSVTVMVHRGNRHEIELLGRFISNELKVPFRLDRVIPSGRALENGDIALPIGEFYQLARRMSPGSKTLVTKICDTASALIDKSNIEPSCGVGASYLFIKHDGRVVLCPTMTEQESPQFAAGNIRSSSLSDIWINNPTFKQFRGIQCKNIGHCPAAKQCRGGCRSNAYLLHGSVDSPDELHCNLHKNATDEYVPFVKQYEKSN